jgi:hypothetical protein
VQDVGHLGGPEVAGRGGCGLAGGLGCHGASLSYGGPLAAAPGPVVAGCSSDSDGEGPGYRWFLGAVADAGTNRTIIETRPSIPP